MMHVFFACNMNMVAIDEYKNIKQDLVNFRLMK